MKRRAGVQRPDDHARAMQILAEDEARVAQAARAENRVEVARARNLSIARRWASHFAHSAAAEPGPEPDPFSVARRLVEERDSSAVGQTTQGSTKHALLRWLPSRTPDSVTGTARSVKSLHDMTIDVFCEHIDHVDTVGVLSVESIRKICSRLCMLRKMSSRVLRLLVGGVPSDFVIPDCSACREDEFAEALTMVSTETLQALELGMCGRVFSVKLVDSLTDQHSFPLLRILSLRGAYRLTDEGLVKLILSSQNLTSLALQQCSAITERGVLEVANLIGTMLKCLSLEGCNQIQGMNLLVSFLKMHRLQSINLSGVGGITDLMIQELVVALGQNLEDIRLAGCTALTDVAVTAISSCCPGLKVLDLDMVAFLTDVSLVALVNGGLRLQRLSLKRGNFSDEALAAMVTTLDGCLQYLSLNSIREAADRSLLALAQHSRSTLEVLDVSWCRKVTDQGLGYLADSCKNLTELRLYGCTQVTDVFQHGHSNPYLRIVK